MKQRLFPLTRQCKLVNHLVGFHLIVLLVDVTIMEADAHMVGINPYHRLEYLDPQRKYKMEWEVDRDASRITFNLTVQTTGYIGFGMRPRGIKSDADIVIGGVYPNSSESYFSDQHAPPHKIPEMDTSQDYTLHEARENTTHTFLSFSRDLDTCDPQDQPIVEDKVSLIWAYSEKDDPLGYHYSTRGEYLVHLLNPDYAPPIERDPKTNYPLVIHSPYHHEDVKVWSWNVPFVMHRDHTTYWCFLKRGPVLSKKHHMIGYDVRFNNPVSRKHLHHVLISKCRAPPGFSDDASFEQHVDQGQLCYGAGGRSSSVQSGEISGPIRTEYCSDYLLPFAVGDRTFFLPPHVGNPFGEDPQELYLIQMHYDNPEEHERVLVDVNIDIFYTSQLRQNEGDLFIIRHESPGFPPSQLIPPFSTAQKTFSICGSDCTRKMLPAAEGIRITAVLLHAHNSGVGLRLRHFRDGAELPPVAVENNFSPSYQQMRVLPTEVHVLPGDQLLMECSFDNVWANGTVVGGFSTIQEMCVAWLFYYNRLPNHMLCASEIDSPEFMKSFLGIENVSWSPAHLEYAATSPRSIAGLPVSKASDMLDWTIGKRKELDQFLITYPHSNRCPVASYARAHTRDENGEPVDLEPEEDMPVLAPLPAESSSYKSLPTCYSRGNVNNNNNRFAMETQSRKLKALCTNVDFGEKSVNVEESLGINDNIGSSKKTKNASRSNYNQSFTGWRKSKQSN